MKKPPANWAIAGIGPFFVIGCAAAMLFGVPPEDVLAGLTVSLLGVIILAEWRG